MSVGGQQGGGGAAAAVVAEELQDALRDLERSAAGSYSTTGCGPAADGHGGAARARARRGQQARMTALTLVPVALLVAVTVYFLTTSVSARNAALTTRRAVELGMELGRLVHQLQAERDVSVLYLSELRAAGEPSAKADLLNSFTETDALLSQLSQWPVVAARDKLRHFASKHQFMQHLQEHRGGVELVRTDVYGEIVFYTDLIDVLVTWLVDAILQSDYGNTWQALVAYQKLASCKEDAGIERSLGSAFFANGGFNDSYYYRWYNLKTNVFRYKYESARRYWEASAAAGHVSSLRPMVEADANNTAAIAEYRALILLGATDGLAGVEDDPLERLARARSWFAAMTRRLELLLRAQQDVAAAIISLLDTRATANTAGVVVSGVLAAGALVLAPGLASAVTSLTALIHSYAHTLEAKSKELKTEKKRTDSLLYQMLPPPVADALKVSKDVAAEYFSSVTIYFSDIVDFASFSHGSSPLEVVDLLNLVYRLFDERISRHDVYKVETVGDSYMVASGVPTKNGDRHAVEIANMALALLEAATGLQAPGDGRRVRLRVGIHTGACMGGVVGNRMPRYCLFGDTVNTASRMQTYSLADHIHVSATTHKLLAAAGGEYQLQPRGGVTIKGKGRMATYWLLGGGDSQ